ncbi:MAG: universal stress protein [Blastocatellia bacterium]|nr:universal stress protein [Blastocatellia bacterium]
MFNKILLASDGSDGALRATEVAAEIAQKFNSELTVLHVFVTPIPVPIGFDTPGVEFDQDLLTRYAEEVRTAVERRTNHILDDKQVNYTQRQELGHPAATIVKIAEHEHYDLIVVGRRGLGQFKSLLLGSVSDHVSRHAHCPVLIVK